MIPGWFLAFGIVNGTPLMQPSRLALGIWYSSLGMAVILGLSGLTLAIAGRRRRLVHALRCGTASCVAQMMGLALMLAVENPQRWNLLAWLVSFLPFTLALASIIAASWRGEPKAVRIGPADDDTSANLAEAA
jgi:hypothetical protein